MARMVDRLTDKIDDALNDEFQNYSHHLIENNDLKKRIESLKLRIENFEKNEPILTKEINSLLLEKRNLLVENSNLTQKITNINNKYEHEVENSLLLHEEIKRIKIDHIKLTNLYMGVEIENQQLQKKRIGFIAEITSAIKILSNVI